MDLEKRIVDTLQIPMVRAFCPIIPPCVTCYVAGNDSALFGDGQETEGTETYQVDIWDKNEDTVRDLAKKLKRMLVSCEYAVSDLSYMYDNNGKLWRASLMFTTIDEEE